MLDQSHLMRHQHEYKIAPLLWCLPFHPLCSSCACILFLLLMTFQYVQPEQRLQIPMQPCTPEMQIFESLGSSLAAFAANVEELHASLCITHLTLKEDGFSSSASWVVAVSLNTR